MSWAWESGHGCACNPVADMRLGSDHWGRTGAPWVQHVGILALEGQPPSSDYWKEVQASAAYKYGTDPSILGCEKFSS